VCKSELTRPERLGKDAAIMASETSLPPSIQPIRNASPLICPNCKVSGRYWLELSRRCLADYFLCSHCAHVWLIPKPREERDSSAVNAGTVHRVNQDSF
jgi:hypothetical protein